MYLGSGGTDTHFGYCNDPSLNIGGPSLQEMIDSDMKADFDDVLTGNSINFQVRKILKIPGFCNTARLKVTVTVWTVNEVLIQYTYPLG